MFRAFVRALLRLLFRVEVRGTFQVSGRTLIVANHQSFIDPILLGAFLPVMPVWFVHTVQARRWFVRIPLRFLPHFEIDQMNPWAMKAAIELIESGRPLLIFPEGRITETGVLMKIYEGPAFVAAKTGAAVIPIHIEGAVYSRFSRMSGDFPKKTFPRITITVLPARTLGFPPARKSRERRRLAAEEMRRMMQEAIVRGRDVKTIPEAFLDAVALYGRGRRMVEDPERRESSYGDLLKGMLALGRLASRYTAEREYAGVLMPNVPATVSLLLGLLAMRRVPAILNYTSGAEAMEDACRIAAVRVVFTSREFLEKARLTAVAEALARSVRLIYLEDLRPQFGLADKLWLIAYALRFPRRVIRRAGPHEPAFVLYTSGSEGRPKGVVLSHDSVLADIAQVRAAVEFAPSDKILTALPLFHAFGLSVCTILPLVGGARILLYPSPLHYRVIPEMIYDRNCTVLAGTSTFLGGYARAGHPYDMHTVRLVVAGAEKLSPDVRRVYADKFGLRIIEGYGATECSPIIAGNSQFASRPGTVGELLPCVEGRIEPVPGLDGSGVLHVRGPNVMLGYLDPNRPGHIVPAASACGPGWYNTGDIVSIDSEGFVTIEGRLKRFAKIAGEMVSLELAERVAAAASPAHDHASAAVPQPGRGESIVLFTDDAALRREQLIDAARRLGVPEVAVPRRVVHREELPLLGNGKKDYVALNRLAAEMVAQTAPGD